MKTKKESKTKTPQLEVVNDIFMVEKNSRRLVSLKPDIKEAPENMVIPEGIEIIGPAIFVSFRCTNLTDIQFGNGLEYIGKIAFASCRGLEKIVLPDSLRVIESQAFMDCSKLKNVVFNEGLQVIEWSAFYICKNLNEFVLPKSLRVVGDEALQYAKKVTIHGELPHNLMDFLKLVEIRYNKRILNRLQKKGWLPSVSYILQNAKETEKEDFALS